MNLVVCLILTLAALSPAPEITGTVVDDSGKPASGVSISADRIPSSDVMQKTVSASDGSFRFTDLAPGAYGVEAKTDSACAFSDAIRVDTGFTSVVRLRLIKGFCQSAFSSGQFNDSTTVKSGPFAAGYEVRGPRRGYFFPPNAVITTANNHLLVRGYGKIWVYSLTAVKVRRMSSLVWVDANTFPAERSAAVLRAYRNSLETRPSVRDVTCPDCDAFLSDPAPPSEAPFPIPAPPR
jgi:hypothetical protein